MDVVNVPGLVSEMRSDSHRMGHPADFVTLPSFPPPNP
jgi:hypothetical protein